MEPLARLWTWTGQAFIPLAIGWGFFVRGGPNDAIPSMGVLISWGYWGLLATLAASSVLIWTFALHVGAAKRSGSGVLVPSNTTFEGKDARSPIIAWGTTFIFAFAIISALTVFGVRYGESRIHGWNDPKPMRDAFLASRIEAHRIGCAHQPCFAVGQRMDGAAKPFAGVNEYVLYLSDGMLIVVVLLASGGLVYMSAVIFSGARPPRFEL